MSEDACTRVRADLLGGRWDHDHLASCATCRLYADTVARMDGALARGPDPVRAPITLLPQVTRRALLEHARSQRRRLLVAACVTGAMTLAALAYLLGATPLLALQLVPVDPGGPTVSVPLREAMSRMAGSATLFWGVVCAVGGAGLVHALSWEP